MIDDIRLPEGWSRGSSGGPAFRTDSVRLVSGAIDREELWGEALGTWDIAHNIQSLEEMAALRAFHRARRGSSRGFLMKDWLEFTSAANGIDAHTALDQPLGVGDGVTTVFPILKRYADAANFEDRRIYWPVAGSVLVAADGVEVGGFTVQRGDGTITFAAAPAAATVLTSGFHFDVPVHFIDDQLSATFDTNTSRSAGSIPLEELLGENAA